MAVVCNSCNNTYEDSMPFCPYCGALQNSDYNTENKRHESDIFSDFREENNTDFLSLDEPTTEYEVFKNALNKDYSSITNNTHNKNITDYSKEYINANKLYNNSVNIDDTFDIYYSDNELNNNGNIKNINTNNNNRSAEIITPQKKSYTTSTSPVIADNSLKTTCMESIGILLSIIVPYFSWIYIMKCDHDFTNKVIPFMGIAVLVTAAASFLKELSLFDKLVLPVFGASLFYFSYHLGKDLYMDKLFVIPFICSLIQMLISLIMNKYSTSANNIRDIPVILNSVLSFVPIIVFINHPLKDTEIILMFMLILFGIIDTNILLFKYYGTVSLISISVPCIAEILLLKIIKTDALTDSAISFVVILTLIIPFIICNEIDTKKRHKDHNEYYLFIATILLHVLLFIIYLILSAGIKLQYITLWSEIGTIQNAIFMLIIVATDSLYMIVKLLIKRT